MLGGLNRRFVISSAAGSWLSTAIPAAVAAQDRNEATSEGGKALGYLEIDWAQEKPDPVALDADWQNVNITDAERDDPRLDAMVQALRETHDNGGVQLGRFSIESPPSWRWYLSRNRFEEAVFFRRFFQHAAVKEQIGDAAGSILPVEGDLGFQMEAAFTSTGRLADTLSTGGAYHSFKGRDQEVLRLVQGFSQAAFQDRYSDLSVHVSYVAWSSWFKDIAWDASYFWFDGRSGVATTLLITDTD